MISPKAVVVKPVVGSEDSKVKNKSLDVKKEQSSKQSRFYGRARVGLGYEYQRYTGSFVKSLWNEFNYDGNKSNQAPVISLGYNMYYTLNKRFALLGGLEVQERYPIEGKKFASFGSIQYVAQYGEYLRLNAKLGLKTDLTKDVAVEAYGIIGGNMAELSDSYLLKKKIGLTTGAGVDFVIADRFIVGAEYRCGLNKFKFNSISFEMKTHSVLAKVGYQFG